MRKLFLSLFFLIFTCLLFAKDFPQNEKNLIYKALDARLQTRLCNNPDDAIKLMEAFKSSITKDAAYETADEELRFVIENMISLEEYNYMYAKNADSAELKPFILKQYDKIEAYKKAHEGKELNCWFILSSGDVINSSMQFISQSTAIKLGLKEKEEYDTVAETDGTVSFGRINRALWYYFAPAIGGGNKAKAIEDFQKAVEYAECDYERFYSRVYLSQVYYDEGNKAECEKLLNECDSILPGNVYTPFIRTLNQNDFSLLYYTENRKKVEKKLGI